MIRLAALSVCATALLLASCTAGPVSPPGERVGRAPAFIYGGTKDTTHQAVVNLISQPDNQGYFASCSGTIIKVSGTTGYVLTAAHCCAGDSEDPWMVLQGNDYESPDAQYMVTDVSAHPGYNGHTKDFCMVRFTGANGGTPFIPAMTPAQDDLQAGDVVEFVGYGVTDGPNGDYNTKRMHVSDALDSVTTYLLNYDQQPGGPCSGDSGGPSLSVVNGQEVVSGVTSFGDEACTQFGSSGRVSAVYDSFIAPYLSGEVPAPTCDDCAQAAQNQGGTCAQATSACVNDDQCIGLADCLSNCSDQACVDDCASQYSAGIDAYNAVIDCICNDACASECATECGGSSSSSSSATTSSSSTGSGSTTSTGSGETTTGAGGGDPGTTAGAGGTGESSGSNGWSDDDDDDDDSGGDIVETSACSAPAGRSGGAGAPAALGLALAGLALARRRRG
jgi:hypothetical protein